MLIVMMIIEMTTLIPKILIMLDLWLGMINASNINHVRKTTDEELLHVAWSPPRPYN